MIEYTWGIASLEAAVAEDGLTNVVKTIHWTLSAVDGTDNASCYGSVAAGDVDPDAFIPYEDLTQEEVIGWLEALLDGEQLRESLAAQITAAKFPSIIKPELPWA